MYAVHFWRNENWYLGESLESIIFNTFEEAQSFVMNKGFIKNTNYLNRNFYSKHFYDSILYAEISLASFSS